MKFNEQDWSSAVTLSAAKGLARWAERCFAALSMTLPVLVVKFHNEHAKVIYKASIMNYIISREELQHNGNARLLQSGEHGDVPISFFLVATVPGRGPSLHSHPYEEVFVMHHGQATFTVGDSILEVHGGEIVVAPANTPHKFKNSGDGPLQMINIHPTDTPRHK
jgi:mannose-6-phosphate isomerase-like protein (cupin superfamily)